MSEIQQKSQEAQTEIIEVQQLIENFEKVIKVKETVKSKTKLGFIKKYNLLIEIRLLKNIIKTLKNGKTRNS